MAGAASNPLNKLEYSNRQGYSKFDLSKDVLTTMRFAELTPIYCERSVFGDKFTLKVSQNIQNFLTLNSPMLGSLRYHSDFFAVPKKAMLPHTYELLVENPNRGDDVPDDAYPYFDLRSLVKLFLLFFKTWDTSTVNPVLNRSQFYCLVLLYNMCGFGTLPDYLHDRSAAFTVNPDLYDRDKNENITWTFGQVLDKVFNDIFAASENNTRYVTLYGSDDLLLTKFELKGPQDVRFMFNYINSISEGWYLKATDLLKDDFASFDDFITSYMEDNSFGVDDILPYVAYQMLVSQFYTIDTVDNVYNYKMWMLNMESLVANVKYGNTDATYPVYFDYNGGKIQYDLFSNKVISETNKKFLSLLQDTSTLTTFSASIFYLFSFYQNLFAPATCLRYRDYFVGARTQPLAVGDVTAPVTSNEVSAIDVTKSISMQRFLNAVNRTTRDLSDYAKSIFGVDIPRDTAAPYVLASEIFNVSDVVNINTADSQGTRKANISSNNSKYAYEASFNQEVYIIGLGYFDFLPVYPYSTDRHNFHKDRFDSFQPMLQDVGDQPVYRAELCSSILESDLGHISDPMAYQLQDAEYKFPISTAHGGFINNLPSWAFIDYNSYYTPKLSSRFIRLYQWWFDKYFSGLTNMSAESYFHFMLSIRINCTGLRKMQFKPGILQQ